MMDSFQQVRKVRSKTEFILAQVSCIHKIPNLIEIHGIVSGMKNIDRQRADRMISAIYILPLHVGLLFTKNGKCLQTFSSCRLASNTSLVTFSTYEYHKLQ